MQTIMHDIVSHSNKLLGSEGYGSIHNQWVRDKNKKHNRSIVTIDENPRKRSKKSAISLIGGGPWF